MKKEKTEEEKAEKIRKKSERQDRKLKKARNASALSQEDLERLAEVRRSLRMSSKERDVLSGVLQGGDAGVVGLSYSQTSPSDTSDTASTYSKGSLNSQGKVRSILKSRGGSSVVSPENLDDSNLLFQNTIKNMEYTYSVEERASQERKDSRELMLTYTEYTYSEENGGEDRVDRSQDREQDYAYFGHTRVEGEREVLGEAIGLRSKSLRSIFNLKLPELLKEEGKEDEVEVEREGVMVRRLGRRGVVVEGEGLGLGRVLVRVEGEGVDGRSREEVAIKMGESKSGRLVVGVLPLPGAGELEGRQHRMAGQVGG